MAVLVPVRLVVVVPAVSGRRGAGVHVHSVERVPGTRAASLALPPQGASGPSTAVIVAEAVEEVEAPVPSDQRM